MTTAVAEPEEAVISFAPVRRGANRSPTLILEPPTRVQAQRAGPEQDSSAALGALSAAAARICSTVEPTVDSFRSLRSRILSFATSVPLKDDPGEPAGVPQDGQKLRLDESGSEPARHKRTGKVLLIDGECEVYAAPDLGATRIPGWPIILRVRQPR